MRGVVINGKFLSQKTTGVQRVARALSAELFRRKEAFDVSIATPKGTTSPWGNQISGARLTGVPWEQLELPGQAGSDLLLSLCNVAPISRSGDIVMIHDAQAFISPKSYSTGFRLYYQTLLPIIGSKASRVLTVSEYSAECLVEAGIAPRSKIEVIYNGVDHILDIQGNEAVLDRLDIKSRPYFAALGSVQHHKNVKTIVAAARGLSNQDVRLVLIGAASRSDYEDAGIEIGENVCLAGRLSDEEMKSVIQNAQAFLFPSLTEGFGLPPLEAMCLGTPAIVAPCGALPELCKENALYCTAERAPEWTDCMNKVIADSSMRGQYSKLGIEAARDFTWDTAGSQLVKTLLNSL